MNLNIGKPSLMLIALPTSVGIALAQAPALDKVVQLDAKASSGIITYRQADYMQDALVESSTSKMTYAADGSLRQEVTFLKGNKQGQKFVLVKSKAHRYFLLDDDKGRSICVFPETKAPWPVNDTPTEALAGKPCFAIGLGLSGPETSTLSGEAGGPVLSGPLKDGLIFKAQVDPKTGVPTSVNIWNKAKLFSTWTYKAGRQGSYAIASSEFTVPWAKIRKTFDLTKVDFRRPAPSELSQKWFAEGRSVEDHRVGEPVTWTYEELLRANGGDTNITPERLLELTKANRAAYHAERKAAESTVRQGEKTTSTMSGLVVVGVIGLVVLVGAITYVKASK